MQANSYLRKQSTPHLKPVGGRESTYLNTEENPINENDQENQLPKSKSNIPQIAGGAIKHHSLINHSTTLISLKEKQYDGETNEKGEKEGQGTCQYEDGSVYTGEWTENKRHGKGSVKFSNGEKFTGTFVNDIREGPGELVLADGNMITTTWREDKKNGEGLYHHKNSKLKEIIMFREDQMVNEEKQNTDNFMYFHRNLSLCLTVIIFIIVISVSKPSSESSTTTYGTSEQTSDQSYLWWLVVLLSAYAGVLVETYKSYCNELLTNLKSCNLIDGYIEGLKASPPKITIKIENFHYEKKTTWSNLFKKNKQVKIKTFSNEEDFNFDNNSWYDKSQEIQMIDHLKETKLVRLILQLQIELTDESRKAFEQQRNDFEKNNTKDKEHNVQRIDSINGYEKYILMYNPEKGQIPWYAKKWIYWVASGLLLGWLMRVIITKQTRKITYVLKKGIFIQHKTINQEIQTDDIS